MALDAQDLVDQLDIYLGLGGTIDQYKGHLVIALTLERVGAVVQPVPDAARPIILVVAGRAYSNPQGATTETAGPFTRTLAAPGVYLTELERADLRSLAGRGGAFTIRPGARAAGG